MESHAAELLFEQAFKEGMYIAVHWQDADSSSGFNVDDVVIGIFLLV